MEKKRAEQIIKSFQGKRIAVIGDLILDVYIWGKVERISPEAPVPVVLVKNKTFSLGGASNVMRNIVSLGGKALAFGILGNRESGSLLLSMMQEGGIDTKNVIIDSKYITIEKQRIFAESQQLARIDHEDKGSISNSLIKRITNKLIQNIQQNNIDAIIIEDYAKGLITDEVMEKILEKAKSKKIPVALDPHPSHKINAKGFTLMTPNQTEAFTLASVYLKELTYPIEKDKNLLEVVKKLNKNMDVHYLLVTLGAKGMALFEKNKKPVHIPTKAKEVFDVTGAGDTVIAVNMLSLLGGASGIEAAEISNHAAGIVVGRVGTSSIMRRELLNEF